MSTYDDGAKDDMFYEINEFLKEHTVSELMKIVTDAIAMKEYIENNT